MKQKRIRNAAQSKKLLLSAAEEHFAARGYFGARIDEIAASAELNKRMIYEYFGNKEDLYKEVLYTVYKRMEDAERQLVEKQYQGLELISQLISLYFDFLQANPTFVALLMWENLNKASYLKTMPDDKIDRPTIATLAEEIAHGQANGTIRPDVDIRQTVISLITVCFGNFSNSYTLSKLFHCDLNSPAVIETRKQHTRDIIIKYLAVKQDDSEVSLCGPKRN